MNRITSFNRNGVGFFGNRLQVVIWAGSEWAISKSRRMLNVRLGRLQIFITW